MSAFSGISHGGTFLRKGIVTTVAHPDAHHEVRSSPGNAATGKLGLDDFHAFYERNYSDVIRFLLKRGAENFDAEDIVAETFVALMRVADWSSIRDPQAYLYKIALNALYRFRSSRQELSLKSPSYDPIFEVRDRSADPPANVYAKEILGAMRSLPPRQQAVMALYVDGYTPVEIAGMLDLKEDAVRQNLHRARRTLRTLLYDQGAITTGKFG
jgi:RNA polymerase sigma factor (sigma-70 family)